MPNPSKINGAHKNFKTSFSELFHIDKDNATEVSGTYITNSFALKTSHSENNLKFGVVLIWKFQGVNRKERSLEKVPGSVLAF